MNRITRLAAIIAITVMGILALTITAAAEAEFEMEIPYGTPTVDGVIEEGEYEVTYVMDSTTATAWVGEVGSSSVTWHLAWDEGGLYYAGTINDSTPSWRDKNHYWVGIDCLELAINPGLLLGGSKAEGVFFSFGSAKDGSIVAWRHNFADGLVSDAITGANTGHVSGTESYSMEVYIPWSLVQMKERCTVGGKEDIRLDSTGWEAKAGAQLGLLPCAIDSFDKDGENIIAYKFNGTDFIAKDFIVATLIGSEEVTEITTEAVTDPTTEDADVPTEAPTDGATLPDTNEPSVDTADGTPACTTAEDKDEIKEPASFGSCFSTLSMGVVAVVLAAAGMMIRKKKE